MNEKRQRMLEDQLRSEIGSLIIGGELKDPRVGSLVSVTRVEVARDASAAKVFVSTFAASMATVVSTDKAEGTAASAGRDAADVAANRDVAAGKEAVAAADRLLDEAVAGLQSAAGFIQAQLAKRIHTRLTPRLHFVADRGIREGFDMTERLRSLFP